MGQANKYDVVAEEEKTLEQLLDNFEANMHGIEEAVQDLKETYAAIRSKIKQ